MRKQTQVAPEIQKRLLLSRVEKDLWIVVLQAGKAREHSLPVSEVSERIHSKS